MQNLRAVFERPPMPTEGRHTQRESGAIRRLLRARARAKQQLRGLPGAMPTSTTRAASGHPVRRWQAQGRQALMVRALHLGVLVAGKTPEAVGKLGVGQFRTWKSLAAAVQRAERAEEIRAFLDEASDLIPRLRDTFRAVAR